MGSFRSKEFVEFIDLSTKCVGEGYTFEEETIEINGSKRNVVNWIPSNNEAIKGIVIICHGVNHHTLSFYYVANYLVARNYAVFGMDHVSHGKSEGIRGVVPDYRILCNDFIHFANLKRKEYSYLPAFIFAHSMGTLITINSINRIDNLTAVLFSGVALFPGPAAASPFGITWLYPVTKTTLGFWLISILSFLNPGGATSPLIVKEITGNKATLEEIKKDPRVNPSIITNKTAKELLLLTNIDLEEVRNITIPFLCMHGEDDLITLKSGSEYMFQHARTDITQRNIIILPHVKHEFFNEIVPDRNNYLQMVVNYYDDMIKH